MNYRLCSAKLAGKSVSGVNRFYRVFSELQPICNRIADPDGKATLLLWLEDPTAMPAGFEAACRTALLTLGIRRASMKSGELSAVA